ncbi:MAG: hypothetical protein V7782_07085 [Psychromonas sp.]
MIKSTKVKLMGLLLNSDYLKKHSAKIYKAFVYKKINDDLISGQILQQIDAFNNPNLSDEVTFMIQSYIFMGHTEAMPYQQTSRLITQRIREIINAHLTIEAMREEFHLLSV